MAMSYLKLAKHPLIFLRMTGVNVKEFEAICQRVKPLWDELIEATKSCEGRKSKFKTLADKTLALLLYYRTYVAHEFIGYSKS